MRATFTSAARLHRPSEYVKALKGRRIARGALFVLHASRTTTVPADQLHPRLGMIISKRFATRAVTRNTIKRVIRDVFRHNQQQLVPRDYVVRLHSPAGNHSLTQLKRIVRTEINALFEKATR